MYTYLYIFFNVCLSIFFEQTLRFFYHFFFFVRKIFHFQYCYRSAPLLKVLPSDNLKFVCLNTCLGCKSCKNWSIVTKIGYVFYGSNLSLYTKNCESMIDTFYRATSKSWIFVWAVSHVKNWSIVTKIEYGFHGSNLSL